MEKQKGRNNRVELERQELLNHQTSKSGKNVFTIIKHPINKKIELCVGSIRNAKHIATGTNCEKPEPGA